MPTEDEFVTLKQEKVTIKEVIIMHIKKISDISCKELTPSFWSKKPVKVGEGVAIVETYHPDTRLAYCNAVDFLLDLMMPSADKKFMEALKLLNTSEAKKFKEHKENKSSQDDWVWIKQGLRRTLFGQLILLIKRAKLFEASLSMSDQEIGEMLEEEDEKERELEDWKDANV